MATIQGLRAVLADHFGEAETVIRRLVEAAVLPTGRPGVGGSAPVTPRHGAVALLALSSLAWCDPIEAPQEARRLSGFALSFPRDPDPPVLAAVLSGELRRCADPNYRPGTWCLGEHLATRDLGDVHWAFEGERLAMPVDDQGRPLDVLLNRQTVIAPALIRQVGALFAAVSAEAAG